MLELPESYAMSGQLTEALEGRTIEAVMANQSPHGFAWFHGLPEAYPTLLSGCTLGKSYPVAGQVQIDAGEVTLLFNDGINLRHLAPGAKRPAKHQLLLEFDDGSALCATVQMYGGMMAFPTGTYTNPYYTGSLEKPSPLTDAFDQPYFEALYSASKPALSTKAFLATEQRIPGLGNGVLQDILFIAGIHPARPIRTLEDSDVERLYTSIKETLARMAEQGGRDTEKDLYGKPGGYRTLLSRKTLAFPCPKCGGPLERKAYLGGNVYFCPACQPLIK